MQHHVHVDARAGRRRRFFRVARGVARRAAVFACAATLCAGVSAVAAPTDVVTTTTLKNGLVVVMQEDHSVPRVHISMRYGAGSAAEAPGKTGFAHLFEHLMFQGSENYRDEFFGPFELVGAPWVEAERFAESMNARMLPGVYFRPAVFEPTFQKHAKQSCGGCQVGN